MYHGTDEAVEVTWQIAGVSVTNSNDNIAIVAGSLDVNNDRFHDAFDYLLITAL